jgi:hypothetical protein
VISNSGQATLVSVLDGGLDPLLYTRNEMLAWDIPGGFFKKLILPPILLCEVPFLHA